LAYSVAIGNSRATGSHERLMELRHLRYFLMIAQTENVRRAARNLHITQPAITRQLRDLEEELGIDLFERLPRGLKLSAAGRTYQEDVARIMIAIDQARERAIRVAAGEQGLLRIGYLEISAWKGVVPETFQHYTRKHPAMRVKLVPGNTARQYELLRNGEIDGGFVYPFADLPDGCEAVTVRECNIVLAIPASWSNRFCAPVKARSLDALPFIGFHREEHPAYYDHLMATCGAAGITLKIVQLARDEGAVLSLVCAGIGVAIVNDANRDRAPAGVRFLPLADCSLPLKLHFAWRSDNRNPALPAFVRMIREHGDQICSDHTAAPALTDQQYSPQTAAPFPPPPADR
jgi:DNA-binding transcriptional LysR family regulator